VNADADMNLLGIVFLGVMGFELRLNTLGALHGVDDGGEVYQEGIPDGLDDNTVMLSDSLPDSLIMHVQQPQCASFVAPHLTAEADDISEHDRGQSADLSRRCL
jgi:hypothetical protein